MIKSFFVECLFLLGIALVAFSSESNPKCILTGILGSVLLVSYGKLLGQKEAEEKFNVEKIIR